jgi:hypothetical protein
VRASKLPRGFEDATGGEGTGGAGDGSGAESQNSATAQVRHSAHHAIAGRSA